MDTNDAATYIMTIAIFYQVTAGLVHCKYIKNIEQTYHQDDNGTFLTLVWVVRLADDASINKDPDSVADDVGLISLGHIGLPLKNYYFFVHPVYNIELVAHSDVQQFNVNSRHSNYSIEDFVVLKDGAEALLELHPAVLGYHQEVLKPRVKRTAVSFADPLYNQQWHLVNRLSTGFDLNVTGVWASNVTGKGVTVCIVDDGLEWRNRDLINNYNAKGSWDLNDNDPDPSPEADGKKNEHGTRCAGEVAASANDFCGVGVSYGAQISGIRVLDGQMTDSLEAMAFTNKMDVNDIYSCSWGPEDDGKTVDGPQHLSKLSMELGIQNGRSGYGTIYVVANGNGGMTLDNCNFDGYANSIYTVTIGAVTEHAKKPFYAEECSCILGVTYSSGGIGDRNIVTTDWTGSNANGCTNQHSGTSAAAPLAAGLIALVLEANPCLSWRDVQYIIILTSTKFDFEEGDWLINKAGLHHSYKHGFGMLNGWRLVNAAKVWASVPWMSSYFSGYMKSFQTIPFYPNFLALNYTVQQANIQSYFLWILEHVEVSVTLRNKCRGNVEIMLVCPSGTKSLVASTRPHDSSKEGFKKWTFSTVRCWGESPIGNWSLYITDKGNASSSPSGLFEEWELVLHGTPMTFSEFQSRKRNVEESFGGAFLNNSSHVAPCSPPGQTAGNVPQSLTEQTMKILILVEVFIVFLALFETFEYLFCYNDEKKKFLDKMESAGLLVRASNKNRGNRSKNPEEKMSLLGESSNSSSNNNNNNNGVNQNPTPNTSSHHSGIEDTLWED